MNHQEIIQEVIKRIKRSDFNYEIKSYLASKEFSQAECNQLILEAEKVLKNERLKTLPLRNKINFAIWLVLFVSFIFIFFIALPNQIFTSYIAALSITGALLISFTGCVTLIFFKSWKFLKVDKRGNQNINFLEIATASLIPAIMLIWGLMMRFEYVNDQELKANQVHTEGIVVNGQSVKFHLIDDTYITVKFRTLEGKIMIASEDLSEDEYFRFYDDQIVRMVYSSENPLNIAILTNTQAAKKFLNSEERSLYPKDLISLINEGHVGEKLDRINSGWTFNDQLKSWENIEKNMLINMKVNELTYISNKSEVIVFPRYFEELGFKSMNESNARSHPLTQKEQLFESNEYYASIKRDNKNNLFLVKISKKN